MRCADNDEGAGSVLAVALIAAVISLTAALTPLYVLLSAKASVAAAADSAALAAADARVGAATGFPCDRAAEVAAANGAAVRSCAADGLILTVSVGRSVLGYDVQSTATAGPPSSGAIR